jgi:hypothetical protein
VLVSYSVRLAEGATDLAAQVGGGIVTVVAAGGTDDRLGPPARPVPLEGLTRTGVALAGLLQKAISAAKTGSLR